MVELLCDCQGLGSFRERDFRQEDGEHSDSNDSNNSSQSPGTRSSRMRRATFPVDDEDVPSHGESSQESSPRSYSPSPSPRTPESPKRPPLPPARSLQSPLRPIDASFQGQSQKANGPPLSERQDRQQKAGTTYSGHLDGQQQEDDRQYQSSSPKRVPERRKSIDDGFNSDPEQSSRAMRLQATHQSRSENSHMSPPGVPRPKGIRRVASEAQLLSRYAGRAGTGQKLGSFGSHTSDSTRSFDEYLRNHRSPSPSPKSRRAFVACTYTASVMCFTTGTFGCAHAASVLSSCREEHSCAYTASVVLFQETLYNARADYASPAEVSPLWS